MFGRAVTSKSLKMALTAIFTSLVCVATMAFSVYVPQTRGFFNVGESMVYITALLMGSVVGSFSGGVGSMIADVLLGYYYYAPATLVIKACEGGIVGLLSRVKPKFGSKFLWRAFTLVVGIAIGASLGVIGSLHYSGSVELYLGIPPPASPNVVFLVPPLFWYSLALLVTILTASAGFVLEPELGWMIFAMIVGGAVMVSGYYLYQKFLLLPLFGIEALAEAEIPVNIGQMLVGLVVATPIVKIALRSFPRLRR